MKDNEIIFNLDDCLRALGLDEKGRVQQVVDNEVLRVCDPYVPMDEGNLKDAAIAATVIGSGEVVYPGPYAHYMWEGILYVDPETGSPYAKQNAIKIPTEKKLQYQGAPMRGPHWVDRAMEAGGLEKVEAEARKAVKQ